MDFGAVDFFGCAAAATVGFPALLTDGFFAASFVAAGVLVIAAAATLEFFGLPLLTVATAFLPTGFVVCFAMSITSLILVDNLPDHSAPE
ncbi:MAG: hypothetical protein WBQ69_01990 [Gallionella sp.]